MRKVVVFILILVILSFWSASGAYAQANASLGGFVQDATKALIPGVTVTLTNVNTGVVETKLTNDAGAYQFPAVPPGTYKLSGELNGFSPAVENNVQLGASTQVQINLTLQVGTGPGTVVQVEAAGGTRVNETSSSVGDVLTRERIENLPLVGNNILDLLTVLPGYRESYLGPAFATVGGLGLDTVNATVNGISTNSTRNQASNPSVGIQAYTNTVMNPDLVGEIRLILAPVDAELGRGNAQIQIQTRSGTNKYTGSVVWNVQNTALNANTWTNNHTARFTTVNGVSTKISDKTLPDWRNINQLTGSYGGPIIKNKTFFFFLYDKQMVNARTTVTNQVLTDAARQGIFRYFPGWNPGNANSAIPSSFNNSTTGVYASVDVAGNPLPGCSVVGPASLNCVPDPASGTVGAANPYPNKLTCFSIFGNVLADGITPINQQIKDQYCPGGNFILPNAGTTWDSRRPGPDSTGFMARVLALAPHANTWNAFSNVTLANIGDGLNTAGNTYLRGTKGSGTLQGAIGVVQSAGDYQNRQQFNIRVDHTINNRNRVSASINYEMDDAAANNAAYQGGLQGNTHRRPASYAFNGTSTLTAHLVNESRFGVSINKNQQSPAWNNVQYPDVAKLARTFLLQGGVDAVSGRNQPVIFNPGANVNGFMNFAPTDLASSSPNWNYADTVRWTHGKHSVSLGGEYRRPETSGFTTSSYSSATLGNFGASGFPAPLMNTVANFSGGSGDQATSVGLLPGFLAAARTNAVSLTYLQNGSLGTVSTPYWMDNQADREAKTWRSAATIKSFDTGTDPYSHQTRSQVSNEWSVFAKDDFKVLKRLTLNLGLRFDLNMSPYLRGGLTSNFVGDGAGLYGAGRPVSGDLLSQWLRPGNLYLSGYGSNATGANGLGTAAPLQCQLGVTQTPIAPTGGGPVLSLPASTCDPNLMSTVQFIGPGSVNPDKTLVPQKGRWSPAIGFAWQVPFFGEGKTTMRGGFQRTYGGAGAAFQSGAGSGPGGDSLTSATANFSTSADPLLSIINGGLAPTIADIAKFIPVPPTRLPGQAIPIANRSVAVTQAMYAPDYITPYTDNFTLSVTRNIGRNYTVDVRFVDTLGRRLAGTQDLNLNNVYHNPELLHALDVTRAGGNDPLFDQMLMGLNLIGLNAAGQAVTGYNAPVGSMGTFTPTSGPVVPIQERGSMQLRRSLTFAPSLANGDYVTVINSLFNFTNTALGTAVGLEPTPTNVDPVTGLAPNPSGKLLRNGCNRIADGKTAGFVVADANDPNFGKTILPRCFPENYFYANPQVSTANYNSNTGRTNYQSGQFQFTARPVQGVSLQGTLTWNKTMNLPTSGYTDPLNPEMDYRLTAATGKELRANGTFELPIGPNKIIFGNSSGWFARAIEKWQTSFILTLPEGQVRSITGNNMLYANGRPDVVGPWDNPRGEVHWGTGSSSNYFGGDTSPYATYRDPQCGSSAVMQIEPITGVFFGAPTSGTNTSQCTLNGLGKIVPAGTPGAIPANTSGLFVIPLLQNPLPGHQGNLGFATMKIISTRRLDGNASKQFRISESKSVQVRIDATNILNHPQENVPSGLDFFSVFSNTFGQMNGKSTSSRTFQAQLRLSF